MLPKNFQEFLTAEAPEARAEFFNTMVLLNRAACS
jgi:hypothetical protein